MARLPQVGGDTGNWGVILNEYLNQSLTTDGYLQPGSVGTSQLQAGAVTPAKITGLGANSGIATLDGNGRLLELQVPDRLSPNSLTATIAADVTVAMDVEIARTIVDVKRFGLKGDGATDDTAALNNLIASLPVVGIQAKKTLYFPAGNYLLSGGIVFDRTITVRGDGENATRITRISGSTGDLFTFKSGHSTIRDLSIDGNGSQTSGDDIVFDASYARAQNLYLIYSGGTAIRIGKATRSLAHRIDQILVRAPKDYCALVTNASNGGSTDGIWSNCDFGTAGLSALRIESSSQNMTNIHTWGSGTRLVDQDSSGFLMISSGHLMTTCQAETNWSYGFHFMNSDLNGSVVTGSKSWANGLSGFAATSYSRLSLIGWSAYNNGLRNVNGASTDDLYAAVRNEGSNHLTLVGGRSFDRAVEMSVTAPSPAMSKGAYVTQIYDYAESTNGAAPTFGIITANSFMRTDGVNVRSNNHVWTGNRMPTSPTTIASASSLPLRSFHEMVIVSGTASISNATSGILGQAVTLKFTDSCTVALNGNIMLTGHLIRQRRVVTYLFDMTERRGSRHQD